jgi:hypothetical protein
MAPSNPVTANEEFDTVSHERNGYDSTGGAHQGYRAD